tara:strand:- start:272 stop:955 length:684 start_codon:yes stop_codon:yes gene_type:complete
MVYKNYYFIKIIFYIFFLLIISNKILNANIIYEKEGILITELELKQYKELYFQNYEEMLSDSKAIKRIFLQKKVLKRLFKKDPELIKKIDKVIVSQYGENYLKNLIIKDFLRFIMIRNEFIIEYFNKDLKISDIKLIFNTFKDLKLPISNNNCLTVADVINLKNNDEFITNFYKNLKNNKKEYKIMLDGETYNVCINQKKFSIIEKKLVEYMSQKIDENFNQYIYEK